jgi:hypothetical protein
MNTERLVVLALILAIAVMSLALFGCQMPLRPM